ncbi:MAG: hypothetical protein AAFV88_10000 [Planctomycetota bacterium]
MYIVFAEKPLLLAVMIATFTCALIYGWMQTGNRKVGLAAIATLLLIPGAFLLADALVTDRERILEAINRTVVAVEANDHATAVEVIGDPATKARALTELPRFKFERARARNIQIKMVPGSDPPEATVDLDASVTASLARGGMTSQRVPRRIFLTFQKQGDDDWKVIDYSHENLIGGPDAYSNL